MSLSDVMKAGPGGVYNTRLLDDEPEPACFRARNSSNPLDQIDQNDAWTTVARTRPFVGGVPWVTTTFTSSSAHITPEQIARMNYIEAHREEWQRITDEAGRDMFFAIPSHLGVRAITDDESINTSIMQEPHRMEPSWVVEARRQQNMRETYEDLDDQYGDQIGALRTTRTAQQVDRQNRIARDTAEFENDQRNDRIQLTATDAHIQNMTQQFYERTLARSLRSRLGFFDRLFGGINSTTE